LADVPGRAGGQARGVPVHRFHRTIHRDSEHPRRDLLRPSAPIALALLLVVLFPGLSLAAHARLSDAAYTSSATQAKNFGAAPSLIVQARGPRSIAFLKFDLSTLPSGIQPGDVAKATLTLWVNRVG